jgi:uncharacterized protein (TIGR00255 family)
MSDSAPKGQPPPQRSAMPRSMTGFARVRRHAADTEVVLSVKSVNHRALDVHFHCPSEFDPIENDMRALIRKKLIRGHIEVRISLGQVAGAAELGLNRPLLKTYLAAFREAAREHGIDAQPDLNAAFRIPGMLGEEPDRELAPELQNGVLEALGEALDALNAAREREAGELVAGMMRNNDTIRSIAGELAEIRDRAIPLFQARLHERLRELLRGNSIDTQRLAQEVAVMVDRSDVSEEISRLRIHSGQLRDLLKAGGEIGKRLDFLLQEMNRETNTILSKTTGIGEMGLRITEIALAAKAEIEKIREQSLNLE